MPLDVEDRFHVLDRGLGLHHRQQHDCRRSPSSGRSPRCRTCRRGSDRWSARPSADIRIGDEVFRFLRRVDHRADHAIGAAVEHLADDAGLVPGHAHHRRHRMLVHRLEALHHGEIVLHAVLHVSTVTLSKPHCATISAEKPEGIASHALTTALPRLPDLFDFVRTLSSFFVAGTVVTMMNAATGAIPLILRTGSLRYARNDARPMRSPSGC